MEKKVLKLETVSPVFCHGNNSLELRPSSFKGMMRYWYRALGETTDLDKLHKKENNIFGSTKKASPFRIRIRNANKLNSYKNQNKYNLLPHKEDKRGEYPVPKSMLDTEKDFKLILHFKDINIFKEVKNTLTIALLLGGIGQRARRGFGSIESPNWKSNKKNDLLKQINQILNNYSSFKLIDDKVVRGNNKKYEYPVIKEIVIGEAYNNFSNLLYNIGQASHKHSSDVLGRVRPGRMASPVFITINKCDGKFYPFITRLEANYNYPVKDKEKEEKITAFIEEVREKNEQNI